MLLGLRGNIDAMPVNPEATARATNVRLRSVEPGDLPALYVHQADSIANQMAVTHPRSAEAFHEHWTKIINDPAVIARAILADGEMVGYVSRFCIEDTAYVGYWIARNHWGRGIVSRALALLLEESPSRPLFARVARSNTASLRVLEKCGFAIVRYEDSPATERYPSCEEAILVLR